VRRGGIEGGRLAENDAQGVHVFLRGRRAEM